MALRKSIPASIETRRLFCILEAKELPADDLTWVGYLNLREEGDPENRSLVFGISLDPRHWGKGYGKSASYEILVRC
jgi:RimJ/RimL family protein N-acetyltransferase